MPEIKYMNLADIYKNVNSIESGQQGIEANKFAIDSARRKQDTNRIVAPMLKNRDYAGAANVAYDAGDVESGQGFDDRAVKSLRTIIDVQNEIAPIFYQASQIADPTTRKQVVHNAISKYGRNMEAVDPGWTERAIGMYAEANPDALKAGAAKGMNLYDQAVKRYKLISTTSGFKRVDMIDNTAEDIGGSKLMAPNASPELQYQMQKAKEAPKGVDVTDEFGSTYRAPQEQANPAFAPQGNNYGNIRPQGQSTGFQNFSTPEEGLSAIDKNLQAYGSKGINTLEGVISRWAPPNENDTARLIGEASKRLGINPNQPIDLNNPAVRQAVSTAIMYQEQGPKGIFGGAVKGPSLQQQEQIKADMAIKKASGEIAAKSKAQAEIDLPKAIDTADYSIALLDSLKNHPGINTAVGVSSIAGISKIPGTDAADFQVRLDQLQGQQFLNAYNTLKGGGQITEVEGKKATDAIGRLSTKQSQAEFIKSVDELKGILEKGKQRAVQKAGNNQSMTTNQNIPTSSGIKFLGFE